MSKLYFRAVPGSATVNGEPASVTPDGYLTIETKGPIEVAFDYERADPNLCSLVGRSTSMSVNFPMTRAARRFFDAWREAPAVRVPAPRLRRRSLTASILRSLHG